MGMVPAGLWEKSDSQQGKVVVPAGIDGRLESNLPGVHDGTEMVEVYASCVRGRSIPLRHTCHSEERHVVPSLRLVWGKCIRAFEEHRQQVVDLPLQNVDYHRS